MKVRYPSLDYTHVPVRWAETLEFSHLLNSASILPAHIEPFLAKVMARARPLLGAEHEQLVRDIAVFIKQEAQHCRQHIAFNEHLYGKGYEGLKRIELGLAGDYNRMLEKWPLWLLLAYCEGFETLGKASALAFFLEERTKPLWRNGNPQVVALWHWHVAEEFEHRSVCHDTLRALGPRGLFGYLARILGLALAMRHIGRYHAAALKMMLTQDLAHASPDARRRSAKLMKRVNWDFALANLRHVLPALAPFYHPAKGETPEPIAKFLEATEIRPA